MSVLMTHVTRLTLGVGAVLCDSRSLALDRFVDLTPSDGGPPGDPRLWLQSALRKTAAPHKQASWRQFLLTGLAIPADELIFGQLRERLLLNLSAGFPETAGVSLDRLTGIPCLPGSAIKGCARRMALETLRAEPQPDQKIELLLQIARVFGWTAADWRPDSDFAWAAAPFGKETLAGAQRRLGDLGYRGLTAGGEARFLPAYPWQALEKDLELEVISCHHSDYYLGKLSLAGAPDVEEPIAAFFPAVAPGHVFVFAVAGQPGWRRLASRWLGDGLATFGLGAKTAAGYGWFDTSEALQSPWRSQARQWQESELQRLRQERDLIDRQQQEEAESRRAAAQAEAMDQMSPQQLEDFKIAQLTDEQFRTKLQNFPRHVGEKRHLPEQLAVVRALQKERLPAWNELKQRAQRGGPWAQAEQAVRLTAKKANLGKMP
jgi:CRISPR-associated protein Cmr6